MTFFHYQRVSGALFDTLSSKLRGGTSVVVMSHRYGGKRYTARRVVERLNEHGDAGVVIALYLHPDISTPAALGKQIAQELNDHSSKITGIFDAVDRHFHESHSVLTLLAPNLDVLPHLLVQQFLQGVRVRAERRQLVVLLGGDQHFRQFVYGPNSEFAVAEQYMLTGFDRTEFDHQVERYSKQVTFIVTQGAREALWIMTGGEPLLMRGLIARAAEERARGYLTGEALTGDEVERVQSLHSVSSNTARQFFAHCNEALLHQPESWQILEALLKGENPLAPLEPSGLELAGVACRAEVNEEWRLFFFSPMAETFLRTHYTPRRMADLYAINGAWKIAFERYAELPESQWVRPDSVADRSQVEPVLHSLAAEIASRRTEAAAYDLFHKAAQYLIGFTEISWWKWKHGWRRVPPSAALGESSQPTPKSFPVDDEYAFSQAIPRLVLSEYEILDLPQPWERLAVAGVLQAIDGDTPDILVVSDAGLRRSISQDRLRLAQQLFNAFGAAFSRNRRVHFLERKNETKDLQAGVLGAIFDTLDNLTNDNSAVCRRVAANLRRLGYRRVLLCLLDARRERIVGVCDDSDQPNLNIADMTDYPLEGPTDIQPFVIKTGQQFVTDDARSELRVNKNVATLANLRGLAIVPILDKNDIAVGTIHVERDNGEIPDRDQLDFVARVGRRLASVLSHAERSTLIHEALDRIPEPIAIADPSMRWRYANSSAAGILEIPKGWRRWGDAKAVRDDSRFEILKSSLIRSLKTQPRESDRLSATELRGLVTAGDCYHIGTAPIRDAAGVVSGAVVHLQDFTRVQSLVQTVGGIISARTVEPALEAVLQAMTLFGNPRTRIYLLRKIDGLDRLVSYRATGLTSSADLATFNSGGFTLMTRNPDHHSWKCIEARRGVIFKWDPDRTEKKIHTKNGLEVVVVTEPEFDRRLGKKPGDYWLDLPLLHSNGEPIGKLATNIEEPFDPQQFWILQLLAAFVAVIIEAFRTNEQKETEDENLKKEGYRRSLATVAHHLLNRVMALGVYKYQYVEAEKAPHDLPALNRKFAATLQMIDYTVRRARDFLFTPTPNPRPADLAELCQRVGNLFPGVRVTVPAQALMVSIDHELIQLALTELLDNARKAVANVPNPTIEVTLKRAEGFVTLSVEDNGPGICADQPSQIYDDFYSVWPDGGRRSTGLGLGWVRRVVEAHGGTIGNDRSQLGGVRFLLSIPDHREEIVR